MSATVDLTGRVFGRLRVMERDGTIGKRSAWACACECGAVKTISSGNLQSGKTRSCGCLVSETARGIGLRNDWSKGKTVTRIKPGDVFGRLTVHERYPTPPGNGRAAFWFCRCECGGTKVTRADSLLQGWTQSCGCLKKGNSGRPSTKPSVSEHTHMTSTKTSQTSIPDMHESNPTFVGNRVSVPLVELSALSNVLANATPGTLLEANRSAAEWVHRVLAAAVDLPKASYANENDKPRTRNALHELVETQARGMKAVFDHEMSSPRTVTGETMAEQTTHLKFKPAAPTKEDVLDAIDVLTRHQAAQRAELAERDALLEKVYAGFA